MLFLGLGGTVLDLHSSHLKLWLPIKGYLDGKRSDTLCKSVCLSVSNFKQCGYLSRGTLMVNVQTPSVSPSVCLYQILSSARGGFLSVFPFIPFS